MKILNEAVFVPIEKTWVDKDNVYTFDGNPSAMQLEEIASKIEDDIIKLAAGAIVFVKNANKFQSAPYIIQAAKDAGRHSLAVNNRVTLELQGINENGSRTFSLEEILKGSDGAYTFVIGTVDRRTGNVSVSKDWNTGEPRVKDYLIADIQRLVDMYFSLKVELDEFTRPDREAKELADNKKSIKRSHMDPENKFKALLDLPIPYEGSDSFIKALFWLAQYTNSISAQIKPSVVKGFEKHFGISAKNHKNSVTIVDTSHKTSGDNVMKYGTSLYLSLKPYRTAPDYLITTGLLRDNRRTISDISFISHLVLDYGFSFGKNDPTAVTKNLKEIFGLNNEATAAVEDEVINTVAEENPLELNFPDPIN